MENKMSKIITKRSDNKYNERLVTTIGFTNPMVLPDIKLYFKSDGIPVAKDDAKAIKIIGLNNFENFDFAFDHKKIIKDFVSSLI